jgi:hypothetical protein
MGKAMVLCRIGGNLAFIMLYVISRFPDNPVTGRGGHVDILDMIYELAQVAYIIITAVILAKDMTMAKLKVSQKELLR